MTKNSSVKVGVLQGQRAEQTHEDLTMAELAAIHELGAPRAGIPARSFIRAAFLTNQQATIRMLKQVGQLVIDGNATVDQALELAGAWGAAEVKKFITTRQVRPDIKQETKDRKGSSTALVDTGRLLNSITHKVTP